MSMRTYVVLDAEIVKAIQADSHPLYARNVGAEARRIAELSGREEFRVIDGRLQALRKAGLIAPNRKAPAGWMLADSSAWQTWQVSCHLDGCELPRMVSVVARSIEEAEEYARAREAGAGGLRG